MNYRNAHRTDVENLLLKEMVEDDFSDTALEDEYDVIMDDIISDEEYEDGELYDDSLF